MKGNALQILLVEDSAGDARLLREMFRTETPGSFVLTHVDRMSDAIGHLSKTHVDIVLLDMGLPDGHGLETVRRAHAAAPDVPLVVLTGMDDELVAAEAMKEGAQDYLIKGQIENRALPRALRYAIERHRMQAETDLLRGQQMQLKDEFLSHVSHELRSPLTAIYQFVSIILDGLAGELNVQQREYLEVILRNSRQLKSMIDDLLEVSRIQVGKSGLELQLTCIQDLVVDTVATLQETAALKGITLSSDIAPNLSSAYADPTRIRQILIILIDNAIKFTPASGTVQVHVRTSERDPQFLLLEVVDSGRGIPAGMTEHIFERLYQAPDADKGGRKGLGLGLHICKALVMRQGGQVWATSELGKGATLSLTLPIFSIANLIAPALKGATDAETSIALIVTEMGSQSGWLSKGLEIESSREVRDVLASCMHSDLDVLLPKMGPASGTEFFFIVAVTGDIGREAITRRIRERLEAAEKLKQSGLIFTVSCRLLPAHKHDQEPSEEYVNRLAMKIQDQVDQNLRQKVATHE
ncbi:MAG TPA: ATP-binding protein [Candidatus Dormibacteraeota bacterium]|nr:ATP-binding protein [Candidatus Dormibacteraeota bacterium]